MYPTGRSTVVGLAAGPDGLNFTALYEDVGDSGPTASGARIYRVRYVNPLRGDYDIDGDVDQGDYGVWKGSFGSNLLLAADGNRDGVVNPADYVEWRDNLGAITGLITATATSSVNAPPPRQAEPAVLASTAASDRELVAFFQEFGGNADATADLSVSRRSQVPQGQPDERVLLLALASEVKQPQDSSAESAGDSIWSADEIGSSDSDDALKQLGGELTDRLDADLKIVIRSGDRPQRTHRK